MSTSDAAPRGPNDPCWRGLVDDAALFPPGSAPLVEAVAGHRRHRDAWYAALVGPLVVSDRRLEELGRTLAGWPLACVLVVTGPVPTALHRARRERVPVVAVEVPVGGEDPVAMVDDVVEYLARATGSAPRRSTTAGRAPGPDDPGPAASSAADDLGPGRAVATAPPGPDLAVELPAQDPDRRWLTACDRLAAVGARLKLRTGGVDARAFPSTSRLARWLVAAAERDLPLKCTAGLHHAVRHTDPRTGFEHHGFLNLLAAVRAAADGAGEPDVRAVLEQRDADGLAATVAGWHHATRRRVRERFTGFGSCSVAGPVDDLVRLRLLDVPAGPGVGGSEEVGA